MQAPDVNSWLSRLNPFQVLVLGYVALFLIGTVLLLLPWARTEGISASAVDALFTAASAATTTGLVVHATPDYTLFGELVILGLIEISGLGYMIIIALIAFGAGKRMSFGGRMLLRESLGRPAALDMAHFSKIIVVYSLVIQVVAVALLTPRFMQYFDFPHAFYTAVFHTISAFCTAGFSLYTDSMMQFRDDWYINAVIMVVSILGAIGFFVLYDLSQWLPRFIAAHKPRRISVHSRFTIVVTGVLLIGGAVAMHMSEALHGDLQSTWLTSAFHVVMASTTTGFNSLVVSETATGTAFLLMILMFIGGSPGSTAGGIKTSALGMMTLFVPQAMLGRADIQVFGRRIPATQINRAFALSFIAVLWAGLGTMFLSFTEDAPIFVLMFEVISAASTGGLSMGITPDLSIPGKLFITASMLVGRIGPLALGFSLVGKPRRLEYKYPEADVLLG